MHNEKKRLVRTKCRRSLEWSASYGKGGVFTNRGEAEEEVLFLLNKED